MYLFKVELKNDLLVGRTITYMADKIGITRQTLNEILNGRRKTTKMTSFCIVKICQPNKEIDDYFKKV